MSAHLSKENQQESVADYLVSHSHSLQTSEDLDELIERAGDKKIVMLGEASHGTHEYYKWRTLISQRLIKEKGFYFIAVEGDWPDCYRVNRYIKNYSGAGKSAFEVLHAFNRWPTWMWANWEVLALAESLYNHNKTLPINKKVGFYGLDVYSLWESMESIINYLQKTDPSALTYAEKAFQCFEPYKGDEGTTYAYASAMVPEPCTREVVDLLREIQKRAPQYNSDQENVFSAEQNALVAQNAEKYYRAMLHGGNQTWNIRDTHMMQTLTRLLEHHGKDAKAIVWAHNTHVGDARATDMRFEKMHNIGELARKEYLNDNVFLVGFGSYKGSVVAASGWGQRLQYMMVPPAITGSWEDLLQKSRLQNTYFLMDDFKQNAFFYNEIGHRAIGVVYNPDTEKRGNYVPSVIPARYDAFMFFEETKALHSLHIMPEGHQMPETYPFGV
ncbi:MULTISPECIES: erythromycin esterase family protein [unclassified Imperialibacter]|uniref:erythromycin esterase family protein n=1 Tax=unclassified Imperialibacter TaxID=2629706 RepID=UPI00125A5973|nr:MULTISPECIES: erythromycin esterase family protein [unclassified Imperialibacter]CAD5265451.1 Erythromycin esterase homolog [Imperialibacter sp. 89]CAD5270304.1 Erythromycin esterase homolog [Imperialibacter sp. 75]VVT09928.1 Erythromycin esterase homolog [Imperialibacter sp. EC-SDR9]